MQLSPHALSITLLFWIAASAPPTWACDDLDPGFGDEPTVGEIRRYTDCLWSEHRLGDLIIFLESNLDAVKNDAWLTRMLGMAYNTHGRTEEARQMLTHAYSLSPEDPVINEALAQVLTVRALQISPRQSDLRAASLGEKCRLPSGLKRKEAERLTQEYIDQARRLLTWLVESSDNVHEQLQFRFRLMDLDRFESNQDYPEVATELIQEMKAQFAIDPNDEARRWLVITLINEANT